MQDYLVHSGVIEAEQIIALAQKRRVKTVVIKKTLRLQDLHQIMELLQHDLKVITFARYKTNGLHHDGPLVHAVPITFVPGPNFLFRIVTMR